MKLFDITKMQPRQNHFVIEKMTQPTIVNGIYVQPEKSEFEMGTVIKCATPNKLETDLQEGDIVWFPSTAGSEITWDKKNYLIIKEDDIIGKQV